MALTRLLPRPLAATLLWFGLERGGIMKELEFAVADGLAMEADHGVAASPSPSHAQAECLNCATKLQGLYCHRCGQSADDHHRSIGHLMWEAVEGFTHLDGRLANTLPALLFHPGRLARDYIEGRRMRHVPPFRLFLISLLIFMFAAEWAVNRSPQVTTGVQDTNSALSPRTYHVGHATIVVGKPSDIGHVLEQDHSAPASLQHWLKEHIGRATQNREFYIMLVFAWAHRLAVLMLPILAGLLSLVYFRKRQFFIFDHLVVAMQYFSFCFLIWAVVWAMPNFNSGVWTFAALIWTPFNLYLILRTAYGSSRLGAAVKALTVWLITVTSFACLVTGLLAFALNEM